MKDNPEQNKMLDFFLEAIVGSGRYIPCRGYEYLEHKVILEIENILHSCNDQTAIKKIKKLL